MANFTPMPELEQPFTETQLSQIRDCIRGYMTAKGITAEDLAPLMGYTNSQTIHNYLSTKPISRKTLQKFSQSLEYPYDLLESGQAYYGPGAYAALEARVAALEDTIKRIEQAMAGVLNNEQ